MRDPARTWNAVVVGEDTPCWPVTRRHERLKACASHAAARCCRHDSFASPGRRRLTVAYDAAGTQASSSTRGLASLLAGSMMRAMGQIQRAALDGRRCRGRGGGSASAGGQHAIYQLVV